MDGQLAQVARCLHAGNDLTISHADLDSFQDLLDLSRAAIDRQYQTAVIRELDFDSLPDDRARAKHVAGLLDGYEARHGIKRPRPV